MSDENPPHTAAPPCTISFIVATAENGVIGDRGTIPWKSSADMQYFREVTMGKPVIMGRKTWDSLKRPLEGRHNIVVTRDNTLKAKGANVVHSIEAALARAEKLMAGEKNCEIMVIGGAAIYQALIERADRIYLTLVHLRPHGDTYFWSLRDLLQGGWRETAHERRAAGARDDADLTFFILKREKTAT